MLQVFHLKVSRQGQSQPAVVDMHTRIAFRVDQAALAEILGDEARWRDLGLSFELVAEVEGDDLERAFGATNHVDCDWANNPDVKVMTENPRRSTSVGDLVVSDGETFVVDKFGFSRLPRDSPGVATEQEPEPVAAPRG